MCQEPKRGLKRMAWEEQRQINPEQLCDLKPNKEETTIDFQEGQKKEKGGRGGKGEREKREEAGEERGEGESLVQQIQVTEHLTAFLYPGVAEPGTVPAVAILSFRTHGCPTKDYNSKTPLQLDVTTG